MILSGITTDGKPVLGQTFHLVGTHGLPLEVIISFFQENDIVIDWPDYVRGALKDGHKPRTIRARIAAAVGDVYGAAYRNEVEKRLDKLFNQSKGELP